MFYRKLTAALTAVVIAVSAVLSGAPANTSFAAEAAWSQEGGTYSYTAVAKDDAIPTNIDVSTTESWANIKYLAVDVTVQGTATPVIGATLAPDTWVDSGWISLTNNTTTLYLPTEGKEIVDQPQVLIWNINAGTTVTASNARYLTETPDGVWVEETEGVWTYTHGSNASATVPNLNLSEVFENTDWTGMKNVSLEVSVEGKAKPALCGHIDGVWSTSDKYLENDSTLLFLSTKGKNYTDAQLMFWGFGDNNIFAEAGTKITVTNVKASTEAIVPPAGTWYEESDGVWKYTHGDDPTVTVPGLNIGNYFENTDWAATNNVTLEITVEGKAHPALMAKVGGKDVFNDNNFRTTSTADGTRVVYIYTGGAQASDFYLGFWDYDGGYYAEAGTKITVSNIKASADEETHKLTQGEWIKIGDNDYYYNHGNLPAAFVWLHGMVEPDCDISQVQSVSLKSKAVGGSVNIALNGDTAEGKETYISTFPASPTERAVTRNVNGKLTATPAFSITWIYAGTEVYISDITYSTDPVEPGLIEPNGLLINADVTEVYEGVALPDKDGGTFDGQVTIAQRDMEKIDAAGVLQIYMEKLNNGNSWCQFAMNYSDGRQDAWIPLPKGNPQYNIQIPDNGIVEVEISEELSKDLGSLIIQGENFIYEKAVFVPTPDSEKPVASDDVTDTEKNKIGNCEFKDEAHAPKKGSEFRDGKPEAHKSKIKTDGNGRRYYAQRIVQRVKKSELDGAKSVTIVAFAKNKNKYVKLEIKEYYVDLNMNGSKVEAEGDYAFLTVIFDNIPENEELTFTEFTINK